MIQNDSTRKLEGMGRARGLRIAVRKIEGRKSGIFFILNLDDLIYVNPKPIGKSIREAESWIEEHKIHECTGNRRCV